MQNGIDLPSVVQAVSCAERRAHCAILPGICEGPGGREWESSGGADLRLQSHLCADT